MLKFAFLSKIIRVLLDINTKALYICIIRKQQNNQTMTNSIHIQMTVTIPNGQNELTVFKVQFLKIDADVVIDKIAEIQTVQDLQDLEWKGFVTVL